MANHRAHRRSRQRPATELTPVEGRRTGSHRAERRADQGALHRAVPAAGGSTGEPIARRVLRRLPTLPTLVGAIVLMVAGAGAITLDRPATPDTVPLSSASRPMTGTDAVGYVDGASREKAISRDSERQALQDAADSKLKAAAEQQAAERNAALKSLGKAAEARAGEIAKNQWHLPTQGYHLTARFGMAGGLWSSNHTGLDFAAPTGTPIFAVANGVITETGWAGAYGNRTVETLADGTEIWYAHQSAIGVKQGQAVISGQEIGKIGATGNVTGPHVHLEVRPGGGDPVDPYQALVFHGVTP